MTRKERLKLICELVSQYQIDTQGEIVARLQEAGVSATQATVSRDIKTLGLVKVPGSGKNYIYGLPQSGSQQGQISAYLRRTVSQGQMIHLDVEPGSTAVVKRRILERLAHQLFSVISDDDSILIIVRTGIDTETVLRNIREQ